MKKRMNAVIVDDESLARKDLRAVLCDFEQIDVIAEAGSVQEARKLLEAHRPDVVFLDIQMGGETGFDLLEFIGPEASVIFVTAFDEYAIRAFEVNALDYLLKPVNRDRLALSLKRLESGRDFSAVPDESRMNKLSLNDSIFLKLDNAYRFLRISEIVRISAADDYTELFLDSGERLLAHKTMKEWERRLPERIFCRIHRSTMIHTEKVKRIEPWANHAFHVYLEGLEKPVVMSRRYWRQIRDRLG